MSSAIPARTSLINRRQAVMAVLAVLTVFLVRELHQAGASAKSSQSSNIVTPAAESKEAAESRMAPLSALELLQKESDDLMKDAAKIGAVAPTAPRQMKDIFDEDVEAAKSDPLLPASTAPGAPSNLSEAPAAATALPEELPENALPLSPSEPQ